MGAAAELHQDEALVREPQQSSGLSESSKPPAAPGPTEEKRPPASDSETGGAAVNAVMHEGDVLLRTLQTHSIVSVANARGQIISVSDAFCAISGYSREELLGKDHRIVNSGTHPRSFWVNVWRTIAGGTAWRGEVCNRAKDGSLYWVDSIIAPFMGPHGKIEKYVSIRNDITERRQNERALREGVERLGLATEVASIGVWEWDLLTNRLRWDRTMFDIYGVVPTEFGEVEYEVWANSVVPEELAPQESILQDTVRRCGRSEREFRIRRPDGSIRNVQSIERVLPDEQGRAILVVGVNRDVTRQREAEASLTESLRVIARQNGELSAMAERAHRVVDDVSHEFRTPLAAIKEFASIIADGLAGPVSIQQRDFLRIIDGAVVDLNHMVEDLLDSSKLRSGRLRVDRRKHRVEEIFQGGRAALARKASARSILIEEHVAPDLPTIFVDEEKVRRVVGNLMTNAIKFSTEGGTIRLTAEAGPREGEVSISVIDRGPGLSQEDMDRLFGRFQQLCASRNVAAKGFGLGLNIARELAWLNLGRLGVTSKKGEGSNFSFTLPEDKPETVLSHYHETILATDTPLGDELALLRVELAQPLADPESDEPRSFLASATYATDLVLPECWDCTMGQQTAWWVLGCTRSARRWAERLGEARRRLIAESSIKLAPMTIDVSQVWPRDAATPTLMRTVAERIACGAANAQ